MDLLKPSYASGYAKNASQSAHPNLWDGLVGAWMPSLGVTGETLRDVSGNGNHGVLTNMDAATDWVATSKGLALDFDGVSGRVQSEDESGRLSFGDGSQDSAFSLVAKCYFRTITNGGAICGKYRSYSPFAGEYNLAIRGDGTGRVLLQTLDGAVNIRCRRDTVTGISANQWYTIAATYDGTGTDESIKLFINGNIAASTGSGNDASYVAMQRYSDPSEFTIGRDLYVNSAFNTTANGHITDVYAYNRALSPQEIKQLYVDSLAPFRTKKRTVVRVPASIPAATVVGSFKKPKTIIKPSYQAGHARNASESENPNLWDGLVGAWMPSLGVTGETLRDVSGNGNHGTLTNMDAATDWVVSKSKQSIEISGGNYQHINISDSLTNSNMSAIGSGDHTIISNVYNLAVYEEDIVGSNGIGAGNILLMIVASRVRCHVWLSSGVSVVDSSQTVGTGKWMQVVQRAKFGQTLDVYVNGRKSNSTALPNLPFDKGAGFLLGARYAGYTGTFLGSISDTLTYSRALSPTEIKQLYVDSLAPFRKKQRVSVAVPAGITFKPYWAKQSTQISGLLK